MMVSSVNLLCIALALFATHLAAAILGYLWGYHFGSIKLGKMFHVEHGESGHE